MKTIPTVLSSNLVNRYDMVMPVQVLASALRQCWDRPLPSSIGHDIHRPTGWTNAIALHLQPKLARLFGAIRYAQVPADLETVEHVLHQSIRHQQTQLDPNKVADLRQRACGHLSAGASLHAHSGCAAFIDQGVAARVAPRIFAARDKDNLVKVSGLNAVAPGVFEHEGVLLFAHRFFRRSLSRFNILNDPFLARLLDVADNPKLDVRIALDEDLIGHPDTLHKNIELQYWWGPLFTDDLAKNKWGITRHEADEDDRFFNAIASTEFWWYEQDGRKTFECEELRDLNAPSLGQSISEFGCRFIHSILDPSNGLPVHLDGAIRLYSEDKMLQRVDKNIFEFGRNADYTKLWRVDGHLNVPVWKALINDYYRDNHLPGEYFGGREENDEKTRPRVFSFAADLALHQFAPCTLAVGDGVRLSISYHAPSSHADNRVMVASDDLSRDGTSFTYEESAAVELLKLLKRRREPVTEPAGIKIVMFDDMVDNLPLFEHCAQSAVADAEVTLAAVRDYCAALDRRNQDRMLSFHIGVRYPQFDAHFSFAGHVRDLCIWLAGAESGLPTRAEDIGPWSDQAFAFISGHFPQARQLPPLGNMMNLSGLLIIDRKFLKPDEFRLVTSSKGFPPDIALLDCESMRKASKLIAEKRLIPTTALLLKSSRCMKCNGSYQTCDCIKFIDEDVTQEITDAELLGFFWTDRSAW